MEAIIYGESHNVPKYENGIWKGPKKIFPERYYEYGEILLTTMRKNSTLIGQIDAITEKHDTFGDMIDRCIRCALWMKKQNIKPGDIIGISTGNHLNSIIPVISSLLIGSVFNPWWDTDEEELIRHFINFVQPKAIFTAETNVKLIQKVINDDHIELKVIVFGKVEGLESFDDILAAQDDKEVANFECTKIKPDQPAMILYTSGTTGIPKGVVISYQSIAQCQAFVPKEWMENSTGMNFSSVAWVSGIINPLAAILSGSKLTVFYGISESESFELISKYKVNWITMGTGVANRMSRDPVFKKHDFSSVKYISFGGARVRKNVLDFLEQTFSNAWVLHCYGSTEMGSTITLTERVHHAESCGKVVPNVEIKVMSINKHENKVLGANEEGELYVKTPTIMLCYFKNPEATAAVLDADGWFCTGDLGYYNESGEFFISDRIRELIKYRLVHIPPAPIENMIQNYPGVCEVAVVGKPDNDDVEQPMAFIVKTPGVNITEEEIIEFVDKNLPERFKLRGGVKFIDAFPRTPSQKIAKKILREMAAKMISN
ncbi:luciferin 4-monooxygenase-like [Chelonus insularis]|uniref:luciferin 4-monooxygenase-like n=1 Tax=Chelonus insularis TaxID=460826 RepID=UPI0015894DE9|nr:luciferin 4-monooxygenase-like [Chelonus insularis]